MAQLRFSDFYRMFNPINIAKIWNPGFWSKIDPEWPEIVTGRLPKGSVRVWLRPRRVWARGEPFGTHSSPIWLPSGTLCGPQIP